MRRRLALFAPFTGLLLAFGCTTAIKVGSDGSGAGTTTGSGGSTTTGSGASTTAGSGAGTTSSSTTSSTSSSTTSSGTGTGGSCGWDGSPVSNAGGPCGGNRWANPPTCAMGLTCVAPLPDVVGTCARPGTTVAGLGGTCGGLAALPCTWDLFCDVPTGMPDALGTCVQPACSDGGGQDFCSLFCATTFVCGVADNCTLPDSAAAASGCAAACQDASKTLSSGQVSTLAACYACLNAQIPALCPETSFGPCKNICDDPPVNQAGDAFLSALLNEPGTAALNCTDGENLVLRQCSQSSSPGSCSLTCCDTRGCVTPDVAVQCTVPDSGPIPCTCTAGKNKGKTFEVANTSAQCGNINAWLECNL
jgi:hypothetical protein